MIHTLNFLYNVKKSAALQEQLLKNMKQQGEPSIIIGDFQLEFDFTNEIVHISYHNSDYPFIHKCPTIDWTFHQFTETIQEVAQL